MKPLIKRGIYLSVILLLCIVTDQITKFLAFKLLSGKGMISFFFDVFRLVYAENTGAFLSFGSNFPYPWNFILFIILPIVFLIGLVIYIIVDEKLNTVERVCFSIIAGGGISNLIDRILRNHSVIDFMNAGIGPIRTGIFNVADLFITTGFVILILSNMLNRKKVG